MVVDCINCLILIQVLLLYLSLLLYPFIFRLKILYIIFVLFHNLWPVFSFKLFIKSHNFFVFLIELSSLIVETQHLQLYLFQFHLLSFSSSLYDFHSTVKLIEKLETNFLVAYPICSSKISFLLLSLFERKQIVVLIGIWSPERPIQGKF